MFVTGISELGDIIPLITKFRIMNLKPFLKILLIVIFSIFFGLGQTMIIGNYVIAQSIASSLIPLILIFAITFIIEVFKSLTIKNYKFADFYNTAWKVFIPTIIILYATLFISYKTKTTESSNDAEIQSYKATVQKNNSNSIKKIGDVNSEFLNADNLYENYSYHYSIKFPKKYSTNYGLGKYSEIQAYDSNGNLIVVNVANQQFGIKPTKTETKNVISDKLVKLASESFKDPKYTKQLETAFEERGLLNVKFESYDLTNYNNRFYIFSKYTAESIVNNIKSPIIIFDLVTYYDNKIYHFAFRTSKDSNKEQWDYIVNNTMSSVIISDLIVN